jgi:hypothetical protein
MIINGHRKKNNSKPIADLIALITLTKKPVLEKEDTEYINFLLNKWVPMHNLNETQMEQIADIKRHIRKFRRNEIQTQIQSNTTIDSPSKTNSKPTVLFLSPSSPTSLTLPQTTQP